VSETAETIVQGSFEWRQERLGKITVSEFDGLLAQPRNKADREAGKLSKSAQSYLLDLVAEILTGQEQGPPTTWAMQWGIDNEPAARQVYAERMGCEVQEVGFLAHPDEPMIGGSPDGLVGDDGGLEIKCPANTAIHLGYMLDGVLPTEYVAQVHGHLWITGRKWWDFVSYDPRIKGPDTLRLALWRYRVYRDEEYIRNLARKVFAFRDLLLETLIQLKIGGRLA
jgi:hypothetical protein